MDGELMQYNPATIYELTGSLDAYSGALESAHADAIATNAKIMAVWNGAGAQAYAGAFNKYKQAHENVMQVLKSGRDGVDQAHSAAMSTDGKVSNMFGGA